MDLVISTCSATAKSVVSNVGLNGLQTPKLVADGKQLVFTGFSNGFTDLFIINRDGTGLRRLTNGQVAASIPPGRPTARRSRS